MRAATALVPLLQAADAGAIANLWRGDEWIQAESRLDCTSTGYEALDQELPGHGWPRGQLVELLVDHPGIGELCLLLPALAAVTRTGRTCVWVLPCQQNSPAATRSPQNTIEQQTATHALPYAPALIEAGIDLARTIFVKPLTPRESGWALEQSLRAAHLGALLGWLPESAGADADFRSLRRLHLLAQRHRALVFVLRTARHARTPSPAALRLQLNHDGGQLQVHLLKRRGRPLIEPVALQIHPARWNRIPTPAPSVPSPKDTPAATAPQLAQMLGALSASAGRSMRTMFAHRLGPAIVS